MITLRTLSDDSVIAITYSGLMTTNGETMDWYECKKHASYWISNLGAFRTPSRVEALHYYNADRVDGTKVTFRQFYKALDDEIRRQARVYNYRKMHNCWN